LGSGAKKKGTPWEKVETEIEKKPSDYPRKMGKKRVQKGTPNVGRSIAPNPRDKKMRGGLYGGKYP